MPRVAKPMTATQIKHLKQPGVYAAGGVPGLYIQVLPGTWKRRDGTIVEKPGGTGGKTWLFRATIAGKRRAIGLGSAQIVSLADARQKAIELHQQIREGRDPVVERFQRKSELQKAQATAITFDEAARQWMKKKRAELSNAKHAKQIESQLETYASPVLGKLPIDQIELSHVLKVLEGDWQRAPEAMSRLRGRLEEILNWAAVKGHRDAAVPNPAVWKGRLDQVLPAPGEIRKVKHHAALSYQDVPAFMAELRKREAPAARCLELAILTATRSGEVRGATWGEFNLDTKLWTIPAERTKTGKEHRVPLSDAAVDLLRSLPRDGDLLFTTNKGTKLSDNALSALLRRMKIDATPHGFRSSFRDWTAETQDVAHEVAEAALAHQIPSAVERAYRRGELLEKRRVLMQDWADFCRQS